MRPRLAIVATHPVQYLAPWFAHISGTLRLDLKVFYLWDAGHRTRMDPGFGREIQWDVPLLAGYDCEFVENRSFRPGTSRFDGLWNPSLVAGLKAFDPQAVLLTTYNFASIWNLLLQWRRGAPPLLFRGDSHRLVPGTGPVNALKRRLISRIFSRFSAVLYVGSANREYFRIHGVPEAKLFLSPHAVDNDRFFASRGTALAEARAWRDSLGIPDSTRVILFAGKFEEKKRPLELLHAFAEAKLSDTALLFVGSGPQERSLRDSARSVRNVYFAPFQNQSQMPRTYAAAEVFVLPSFGPGETWGLAVNEAMCLARPVIASDHVGCARDLVIPFETGLTFAAGNIGALANALRTAFEDPARLARWGQAAAERIKRFSYLEATRGLQEALASVGVSE